MQLSELAEAVGGVKRSGAATRDPSIESIEIDSREVEPGALFVALVGEQFDGHDFVDAAIDAGAVAAVVESGRGDAFEWRGPVLEAEDTRRVLGPLAAEFFDQPSRSLDVVGITGTNGKTTTTYILQSIFRAAGRSVGRIGTVDYQWGDRRIEGPNTTPESLVLQRLFEQMRSDGVETVVMEVSSHGLATHRLRGTAFDFGVFTNFSQDHLDFHGDLETYREVKRSLFVERLPESAGTNAPTAVLNTGDATGRIFARDVESVESVDGVTFRVGGEEADVVAAVESRSLEGTELEIDHRAGSVEIDSPLLGDFNVENTVAAAATALAAGIDATDVARGIEQLPGIPGRLERVEGPEGSPEVFVDYAHSPDALRRVLETLRPLTSGELIVVFGCGGDRDRDKRPEMGRIARECADRAVVTSDNPRSEQPRAIIEEILRGMDRREGDGTAADDSERIVEVERRRAIDRAIRTAGKGDAVLIAGKGHEPYQEIGGERRPFDDRTQAERALEQLR